MGGVGRIGWRWRRGEHVCEGGGNGGLDDSDAGASLRWDAWAAEVVIGCDAAGKVGGSKRGYGRGLA
ncbi:hypothetical protein HPP92_019290 [Vanilla planifolia]|uniref:Uncharacterized protein n=1 Tax=Vanilla planifolia TaxID=51239 RepID=A0A835UP87_VANPL|nr:hypothetical protein HPP92_019290 [Vanilla planifolia]